MAANPGALRFNTDSLKMELFDGNQWVEIVASSPDSQTGGARGVFFGGFSPGPITYNVIDYITISTTGNAIDFGDIASTTRFGASCASSTRGIYGGGLNPTLTNSIFFVTISSTGNTSSFGTLTQSRQGNSSGSNSTRGIFSGGYTPTNVNTIDYITISSTGNAVDFGDLTTSRMQQLGTVCSSTRCVQGGGNTPSQTNIIDFITIATLGNATDFGDLINGGDSAGSNGSCSNSIRGLFAYCRIGPTSVNNIDFITIATLGNAQDFGDKTTNNDVGSCSSPTRGVFAGGGGSVNIIDAITIMTTGNATDFGDLTVARGQLSACSNAHGGL